MLQVRVVVDDRERASGVPEALEALGVRTTYRMLDVGDYIISEGIIVERKQVTDFLTSLFNGRLFDQAQRMREACKNPVVVVEGDLQEAAERLSNQRVLWGALTSLSLSYGAYVFNTATQKQTADLVYTMAKREAAVGKARSLIQVKKVYSRGGVAKAQLYAVASLPGIGPKLAERMLKRFKTVKAIFSATAAELTTVEGIGRVKAEGVAAFLNHRYTVPSSRRMGLTESLTLRKE